MGRQGRDRAGRVAGAGWPTLPQWEMRLAWRVSPAPPVSIEQYGKFWHDRLNPCRPKQELVRRGGPMKRTWTIIGVGDVPGSFKWYQALFGQPATLPAHDYFGQILDSDGTVLLCLHEWGAHEHPSL